MKSLIYDIKIILKMDGKQLIINIFDIYFDTLIACNNINIVLQCHKIAYILLLIL
jgi:hypothetical protein